MRKLTFIAILIAIMSACNRTPSGVIGKHNMAALLADIYVGEALVDENYRTYYGDSIRQTLRQSVYMKHGVNSEEVDSSLSWYGRHLEAYMEVCKETEEILQKRIDEAERAGAKADNAPRNVSIDGDSVDLWNGIRMHRNTPLSPSDFMMFQLSTDKNWDRGDRYTLAAKGIHTQQPIHMTMAVDYNDGTTEYVNSTQMVDNEFARLTLVLDSAKVATSVYGNIRYRASNGEISFLDSIQLVRTRGRNDNVSARAGQKLMRSR